MFGTKYGTKIMREILSGIYEVLMQILEALHRIAYALERVVEQHEDGG